MGFLLQFFFFLHLNFYLFLNVGQQFIFMLFLLVGHSVSDSGVSQVPTHHCFSNKLSSLILSFSVCVFHCSLYGQFQYSNSKAVP